MREAMFSDESKSRLWGDLVLGHGAQVLLESRQGATLPSWKVIIFKKPTQQREKSTPRNSDEEESHNSLTSSSPSLRDRL